MAKQIIIQNDVVETRIIIAENYIAAGEVAPGGLVLETAATKAEISGSVTPRWVKVIADESNGDSTTIYLHDGSTLIQFFLV